MGGVVVNVVVITLLSTIQHVTALPLNDSTTASANAFNTSTSLIPTATTTGTGATTTTKPPTTRTRTINTTITSVPTIGNTSVQPSSSSTTTTTAITTTTTRVPTVECGHCSNLTSCGPNSTCVDQLCDPQTGICNGACEEGWYGDRCTNETSNGTTTKPVITDSGSALDPMKTAIIVLSLLLLASLASNVFIVVRRIQKCRNPKPKRSFDLVKYNPEQDGQVNLTSSATTSSLEYQPTGILSGLPGEEYEFEDPTDQNVTQTRNFTPQTRVPPPASAKIERPRSTSSNLSKDGKGNLKERATSDEKMRIQSAETPRDPSVSFKEPETHADHNTGRASATEGIQVDARYRNEVTPAERQKHLGEGVPVRPKRRSNRGTKIPLADGGRNASDSSADSSDKGIQMRNPMVRDSDVVGLRLESGKIQKRYSGVYAAPEGDTEFFESDVEETQSDVNDDDDDDGLYENEEFPGPKDSVDKHTENEDDSDPYENEDFVDRNFRRRNRAELRKNSEEQPQDENDKFAEQKCTVQDEEDSDPYENDDFVERNFRRRNKAELRKNSEEQPQDENDKFAEQKCTVQDEEDSDPYENDDFVERNFRRRNKAELRKNSEEQPQDENDKFAEQKCTVQDEEDSDPYENDDFVERNFRRHSNKEELQQYSDEPPQDASSKDKYRADLEVRYSESDGIMFENYDFGGSFNFAPPLDEPPPLPDETCPERRIGIINDFADEWTASFDSSEQGHFEEFNTTDSGFIQQYQSSEHLNVIGQEEDEEIVQLHLTDPADNGDFQRYNKYIPGQTDTDVADVTQNDTVVDGEDDGNYENIQYHRRQNPPTRSSDGSNDDRGSARSSNDRWVDLNTSTTSGRGDLVLQMNKAFDSETSSAPNPWESEPYTSPVGEVWPTSPTKETGPCGFESEEFNPEMRVLNKSPPQGKFRWSVSDTGSEGGIHGEGDLHGWSRALETHLGHENEFTAQESEEDEFDA